MEGKCIKVVHLHNGKTHYSDVTCVHKNGRDYVTVTETKIRTNSRRFVLLDLFASSWRNDQGIDGKIYYQVCGEISESNQRNFLQ